MHLFIIGDVQSENGAETVTRAPAAGTVAGAGKEMD
jgi:hypothetical protein